MNKTILILIDNLLNIDIISKNLNSQINKVTFSLDSKIENIYLEDKKYDYIVNINSSNILNISEINWEELIINSILNLEELDQHGFSTPIFTTKEIPDRIKSLNSKNYVYKDIKDVTILFIKGIIFYNLRLTKYINKSYIEWENYINDSNEYGFVTLIQSKFFILVKEIIKNDIAPSNYIDLLYKYSVSKSYSIGIDLSFIGTQFNGTTEYSISILNSLILYFKKINLSFAIILKRDSYKKFNLNEFDDFIIFDDIKDNYFYEILFLPHQVYSVEVLNKLNTNCFQFIVTYLDVIALRCAYINNNRRLDILSTYSYKYADQIFSISETSSLDVKTYFYNKMVDREVISILITKANKTQLLEKSPSLSKEKYILIMGNGFKHKAIEKTIQNLEGLKIPIIIFGDRIISIKYGKKYKVFVSGKVSEDEMISLYKNSDMLVYPSLYEGFGLPVLVALQLGCKILVFQTKVNLELKQKYDKMNRIYFFNDFSKLNDIVYKIFNEDNNKQPIKIDRSWDNVGEEIGEKIKILYQKPIEIDFINRRLSELHQYNKIGELYWKKNSIYKLLKIIIQRLKQAVIGKLLKT